MTRTACMIKLLRHGALTLGECYIITGWPRRSVQCVVAGLVLNGLVVRSGPRGKGVYSL